LSRDPVDIIETEPESFNTYQFAYNNPQIYSDPSGEFTLIEINTAQAIQNTLLQIGYQTIRQELIDRARGVVTNILISVLRNFIVDYVGGGEIFDLINGGINAATRAGDTWERLLTDAVCDAILGSYRNQVKDLWVQSRVGTDGDPNRDGFNCGQFTRTARRRVISTRGQGGWGPSPDFIIKNSLQGGGPATEDYADNSRWKKAYLIGDIKLQWGTVANGIGENQWKAIIEYARYSNQHQYLPAALYVTLFGGSDSTHNRIVRAGLQRGVYVYLLTLLPGVSFGSSSGS
jgi:hypothetical protein